MPEKQSRQSRGVDLMLDSNLDSVDVAESIVLEIATAIGFHEDDLHKLGMAVRECLVNAVVHGNRYSAHKKVRLEVTPAPDRISIGITDQGEGFELHTVPDPLHSENLL